MINDDDDDTLTPINSVKYTFQPNSNIFKTIEKLYPPTASSHTDVYYDTDDLNYAKKSIWIRSRNSQFQVLCMNQDPQASNSQPIHPVSDIREIIWTLQKYRSDNVQLDDSQ